MTLLEDCKCSFNYAVDRGDLDGVERNIYAVTDSVRNDALLSASSRGYLKIVRCLIKYKRKVDVNSNSTGETALHRACSYGHLNIARFLIEKGKANINATDRDGKTALHRACNNGHTEIVQFLMKKGGKKNVNRSAIDGQTALHFACTNGSLQIVKYLVEKCRANVELTDNNGNTALHKACWYNKIEIVQFLLLATQGEAIANAKSSYNKTPLHYACETSNWNVELVKFLINEGMANVNAITTEDWTPLHYASLNGYLYIVQILVDDFGADIFAKTNDGKTGLDVATENKKADVAGYLRSKIRRIHFYMSSSNVSNAPTTDDPPMTTTNDSQHLRNIENMMRRTLYALAYLATEKTKECPTLVWLVPSSKRSGPGRTLDDWQRWITSSTFRLYDLYFVCQHSYTVVEPKMEIWVTRRWLQKVGPVLKLSLLLIKAAVIANGLPPLPFPIPNLGLDAQLAMNEDFVTSLLLEDSTKRIMESLLSSCTRNVDLPHLYSSQLLELSSNAYAAIVEKAKQKKYSHWKQSMQPVMNQSGKLIWVRTELVEVVMNLGHATSNSTLNNEVS